MRSIFSFLMLALLLTACGEKGVTLKPPANDAEIRVNLPGVWLVKEEGSAASNKGTSTFYPAGNFYTKLTMVRSNVTRNITYEGRWEVDNGWLQTVVTNTDNPEAHGSLGRTNHLKIISLDKRELVFETGTGMTYLRRQ